ncbi:MAG TPA: thioredoxin domain-containing protein [Parasulfuritortus sp.]
MANALAQETSPYLLQHRDNPVDWHPWGPDALELAKREDKPILLSIGYSSCHWCHVMAHESFENEAVAAVMNRLFVNIKVDREERPDLDQIYQTALQTLTRRAGGWPLTMFLTPDQTPFFGGTYFPREPRFGLPGIVQLLESVAHAWRERRGEIEAQNDEVLRALAESMPAGPLPLELGERPIRTAVADIKGGFDAERGGYNGAPKFPRPAELEFMLHVGDAEARDQILFTLAKMAEGGLFDQVGGGFYRYSTDAMWLIPHFEKMLYDNGPLLGLYADAWARTQEPLFARTAEMTVDWLTREMRSPEGLFYSALDADSEHEEGKFYVWTPDQVRALLSDEEYAVAAPHWGLTRPANFEEKHWHLSVAKSPHAVAEDLNLAVDEAQRRLDSARRKLFEARSDRVRPGLDDKRLTSWNALTIRGLARAARRMDRPDWLVLARQAAEALKQRLWLDGRLMASYKDGRARFDAYLDDYAFLLAALLELLQADFRAEELNWAQELADALLARFEDGERGGFYFTGHDHERLILRPKPMHDTATPSGNGMAALNLIRLGHILGDTRYIEAGERTVRSFYAALASQPAPAPSLLTALHELLTPPCIAVLRGPETELSAWLRQIQPDTPDHALVFAIPSGTTDLPAALDKPARTGVTAYVCTGANCLPEIVQLSELRTILSGYAMN